MPTQDDIHSKNTFDEVYHMAVKEILLWQILIGLSTTNVSFVWDIPHRYQHTGTYIHTHSTNQSTKWWYYLQDCLPAVLATPAMLSAYEFEKPYKGLDQGHTGHCLDAHQSCLPAIPVRTCKDVPRYALCAGSVPFAFLLAVVLLAANKTNHNNKWDFHEMRATL